MITEVAIKAPQSVISSPLKVVRPTVRVNMAFLVMRDEARRNSCHTWIKVYTPVATIPGVTRGRNIFPKSWKVLQPSSFAASYRAKGTSL